jgi:hypothetical protein
MSDSTPPPLPPQPPALPAAGRQTSVLAVVSLVAGLLGWTLLPVLGSLGAIIAGHLARSEIRRDPSRLEGDGLAIAGLVLGYAMVVVAILGVLMALLFFGGLVGLFSLAAVFG